MNQLLGDKSVLVANSWFYKLIDLQKVNQSKKGSKKKMEKNKQYFDRWLLMWNQSSSLFSSFVVNLNNFLKKRPLMSHAE